MIMLDAFTVSAPIRICHAPSLLVSVVSRRGFGFNSLSSDVSLEQLRATVQQFQYQYQIAVPRL